MPETPLSPEELLRLTGIAARHGLEEIALHEPGRTVTIRSRFARADSPPTLAHPTSAPVSAAPARTLDAPIMGVFYRSPAPGEPPFVEVGDTVEAGQPIGMIEAMKVFSDVPAETGGRVAAILVSNGTLVQPGDPLIELEGA
ncbi:MAG: acetyl-CoA carboxylase [Armatimonadota bacterium]